MSECPGCIQKRGEDGIWRSLGPHRAGCPSLKADIVDRQEVFDETEHRIAVHRAALAEGCGDRCDHPLEASSLSGWREYHEILLREEERLAEATRRELWLLVLEGAGKLEAAMTDAENILRLPPEDEEQDYWRARHEAAHVVVGLVLGRRLRDVTIEADPNHHPKNQGSTVWIDDGPPPKNLDALTTWAGVIAGPERSVSEGDLGE
jgi:hypothetical protein